MLRTALGLALLGGCGAAADLPAGRYSAVGAFDAEGRHFWLVGGGDAEGVRQDAWSYDTEADTWQRRGDAPGPMLRGTASRVGDHLYVFGGAGEGLVDSDALWAWDLATDSWEALPGGGPSPRYKHAAAVAEGRLWVLGGKSDDAGEPVVHDELWAWDLAAGGWSEVPTEGGPGPLYRHAMHAQDGALYVQGGFDGEEQRRGWLWSLDLDGLAWTLLADDAVGPPVRASHLLVSQGEGLLTWGGNARDTAAWTWEAAQGWSEQARSPAPLARDAFVADRDADGRLWVLGGDPVSEEVPDFTSDVWSLDAGLAAWTEHRDATGARP